LPPPQDFVAEKPKQKIEQPAPTVPKPQPPRIEKIEPKKIVEPQPVIVSQPKIEPAPIIVAPVIAPKTNDLALAKETVSHPAPSRDVVEVTTSATVPTLSKSTNAQPRYRENPEPQYPATAKRRRQEGSVLLEVSVNKNGSASKVEVKQSSGFSLLDEAALDAVRHWQFEPAKNNNEPVASSVEVPVAFKLSK
jgi:periplasmic protein TonB